MALKLFDRITTLLKADAHVGARHLVQVVTELRQKFCATKHRSSQDA